jgi:hypothetical protein
MALNDSFATVDHGTKAELKPAPFTWCQSTRVLRFAGTQRKRRGTDQVSAVRSLKRLERGKWRDAVSWTIDTDRLNQPGQLGGD